MISQPSQKAVNQVERLRIALETVGPITFSTIREYLDFVTRSHTAFVTFSKLVHALGNYFPSLASAPESYDQFEIVHLSNGRVVTAKLKYAELEFLATAYDMAQEVRQDPRRAFRS